ncbi:MAG: hypothetical protein IKG67_01725 [Parasporobacterium sp.]|nr:hypothetical protein [Parasporobacterium sp.]
MNYTVLSPWAEIDVEDVAPLSPRLDTLEGKTIGLFAKFKHHDPHIMKEVGRQIQERFPSVKTEFLQYPKDTAEIENDPEFLPVFKEFLSKCDAMISGNGDMGSCALFCSYNTGLAEKMGVPCVMICDRTFEETTVRGAACRGVSNLRHVCTDLKDYSFVPVIAGEFLEKEIAPKIAAHLDEIIDALVRPLTKEEATAVVKDNTMAHYTFTGTLDEVNREFYRRGWTNGEPIIPPTREAVDEMMRGTDLAPDHVLAKLPPMKGICTVEKLAINAVMAGCLPTYFSVLLAAVEVMTDPKIHLEGYTSSAACWGPLAVLNGPIRKITGVECGRNLMSRYKKASATIGKAIAYTIMNISGCRSKIEDLSGFGHEGRMGMCIGEDEEHSPWAPIHVQNGLAPEDSAITMFWPSERVGFFERTAPDILDKLCVGHDLEFDPGACVILPETHARTLAEAGYGPEDVKDYIVEYARKPSTASRVQWVKGSHHSRGVILPEKEGSSMRMYWNKDHLLIVVAGLGMTNVLMGGGDHGGPVTKKITFPKDWEQLVKDYPCEEPEYVIY